MCDAAAFGALCWPPLAAPGGKLSSHMRRKRPEHMAALLPAHSGRGHHPPFSGEATQGVQVRLSPRDRKRRGRGRQRRTRRDLSSVPKLT